MKKKLILGLSVFCFLLVSFTANTVFAEYVLVPAAAFKGSNDTTDYSIITTPGHWYLTWYSHYITTKKDKGRLVAPVYFPNSNTNLLQMRVDMFDNNKTGRIIVRLIRVDHETGEWKVVFSVNSGKAAAPGSLKKTDSTGTSRRVENGRYGWFLEAEFKNPGVEESGLSLSSVRIEYQ